MQEEDTGRDLFGANGDDILFDGGGADTLTGGAGADGAAARDEKGRRRCGPVSRSPAGSSRRNESLAASVPPRQKDAPCRLVRQERKLSR